LHPRILRCDRSGDNEFLAVGRADNLKQNPTRNCGAWG
jgi:hypothetical protein